MNRQLSDPSFKPSGAHQQVLQSVLRTAAYVESSVREISDRHAEQEEAITKAGREILRRCRRLRG